jgi:hypothetical protein
MLDEITYNVWIILSVVFFISLVVAHFFIEDEKDYDDTFNTMEIKTEVNK